MEIILIYRQENDDGMLTPDRIRVPLSEHHVQKDGYEVITRRDKLFVLRRPLADDGPEVWQMVEDSSLDSNSAYAYLMWFRYYAATSVVAEHDGEPAGFVSGFRPPEQDDTYFVWQVGVSEAARGCGLATEMIASALRRDTSADVRYVEATVTPSNEASLALFRGLAAKLDTVCRESVCFPERLFPEDGHESELLLRIGPFEQSDLRLLERERRQN